MTDLTILVSITDYFSAAWLFDWFINHASYLFVFLFMTVESTFIPFPSEVVVPPAAYLAATRGDMNVFLIVLFATAGALLGALINYGLSVWIGRPLVYRFADSRMGHACLLDREKVDKAEAYFDRHGAVSTLIGRFIPVVRQLISIPAGIARMNLGVFCLFTAIGAGLWNVVLAGLGWWLGQKVPLENLYSTVDQYNTYFSIGGLLLLVGCACYIVYNAFKNKK